MEKGWVKVPTALQSDQTKGALCCQRVSCLRNGSVSSPCRAHWLGQPWQEAWQGMGPSTAQQVAAGLLSCSWRPGRCILTAATHAVKTLCAVVMYVLFMNY
jgi:hypothetical protein